MGHVQHKYTRTYFTKTNPDGSMTEYGVEGYEDFVKGNIRYIDQAILNRLNFAGSRVLEFGFGRGEAIKYVLEHGASFYEGVDFSEHAIAIATEFLKKYGLPLPTLHHADALAFLKEYVPIHKAEKLPAFDIVLMLDFVEHVPRTEMLEIMILLRSILSETAVVAINTPAFRVDNDVIQEGMAPLNSLNLIDGTDLFEETSGMHCNKYTIISLQEFMSRCEYTAISEAHFYVLSRELPSNATTIPSFRQSWAEAVAQGCPLSPAWEEDLVEYAYHKEIPHWHTFSQGRLNGISLLITDFYKQCFLDGEYDAQLFKDVEEYPLDGKTVFDVGGFMGVSSLLFASLVGPSGRVVCFEPNPWNRQRIRSNLSHNPELAKRISLFSLALGDSLSKVEMLLTDNVDSGYSNTSQVVSSLGALAKDHLFSLKFYNQAVSSTTLDVFVMETGIIPDILKVDTEGAEHLFLMGAEVTIRDHRPTLYVVVHSPFCAWLCSQKLQRIGYVLRLLLEQKDGGIIIKAEPQENAVELMDSPALSRELFDLLRFERHQQIRSQHTMQLRMIELQHKLHKLEQELNLKQKQVENLEANISNILQSRSWQITAPIRWIGHQIAKLLLR